MVNDNKLIIINNEKVSNQSNNFYCDNIDMKSIPEGLNKNIEVSIIVRKSDIKRSHQINLNKVKIASNIFNFLFNIFKTFKHKKTNYLIISITPYTFFAYLFLFIFNKKIFVYLRSNGYEEYKCILGFFGPFLYHIMFTVISWKSTLISCRSHLLNGKFGKIVSPSQLSEKWFLSHKDPDLKKIELLYVGRIKVEKGIFSLLQILKNLKTDFKLSIVPVGENVDREKINYQKINFINCENKNDSIFKIYDSHNIFILPSFTEGHPQVLDEALSRLRPVIVFEEISHVKGKREGVFVSRRDSESLSKTIYHIMDNYHSIQKKIMKNTLPTKSDFLRQMFDIIK